MAIKKNGDILYADDFNAKADISSVDTKLATKQDALVSGTNIKTINGNSILGKGNIEIQSGSSATVDSSFSTTSTNPVQNKIITNALNEKQDKIGTVSSGELTLNSITGIIQDNGYDLAIRNYHGGLLLTSSIGTYIEGSDISLSASDYSVYWDSDAEAIHISFK